MLTFTMNREGSFVANFSHATNQCGTKGQHIYRYIVEIEVGESLDDHGFILDKYRVQEYFDREYARAEIALSCERIAQYAATTFLNILRNRGRVVHRVSVTIFGSEFAGLTATWTNEIDRNIDPAVIDRQLETLTPTPVYWRDWEEVKQTYVPDLLPPPPAPPAQPVCDHCKLPVQPIFSAGQNRWIHSTNGSVHETYVMCIFATDYKFTDATKLATVNGSILVQPEVAA
jgi:6-pyruvoyl-tetrahydropterin synthase